MIDDLFSLVGRLFDVESEYGRRGLQALRADGGMSPEMTAWALRSTLQRFTESSVRALVSDDLRGARVAVSLAHSVPTAPLRAIVLPLLRGAARVVVRPSSSQGQFARLIADALPRVEIAATVAADANLVIAYGRDETLESIRTSLPLSTLFEGHGHGIGAVLLDHQSPSAALAEAVAWDVTAYDQLGCLSPQVVLSVGDGATLASRIAEALSRHEKSYPRGPLGLGTGARVMQWHGTLAVSGAQLFRTPGGTVAYLNSARMIESPGGRNIAVVQTRSFDEMRAVLRPYARYLSSVGINSAECVNGLPTEAQARVVRVGGMQNPALDGPEDPRPPWSRITRR